MDVVDATLFWGEVAERPEPAAAEAAVAAALQGCGGSAAGQARGWIM